MSPAGRTLLRFDEQEMNMLWHDYIPVNLKLRRTRSRADSKIRRFSSVVSKQRRW
jgi:hypothetical protein